MKRRIALAILLLLGTGCGRAENSLLLLDKLPDVKSIRIHGNNAFSEGELKKLMVLAEGTWWNPFKDHKYREAQLTTDLGAITTFYYRHGYLRAQVLNYTVRETKGKVAIDITLSEGEPFTVREVDIRGVPDDLHKELEKNIELKPGAPMDPYQMTADRAVIINLLADKGYWETKVNAGAQYPEALKDQALVFYDITLGGRVKLQDLTVSGNQRLNEHAVRREISTKEGEILERKELLKSTTRLLESGYFYDARWDTTDLDSVNHLVDVDFNVRERPVHWVEGGVGLSSTSQLRLSGEWGTRNFFRTGTRFALNTRTDFDIAKRVPGVIEEHRTDLIWNLRGLFGTPWEGQPNTFYRYDPQDPPGAPPAYSQQFVGVGFNARRKFGDLRNQLVFSLENQWVWNQADSAAEAADPQLARETYTQRLATGWIERDTRNSFFDPTHGSYFYDLGQVGWGALAGSGGFAKLDGSAIHIVRLPVRSIVVVGRIQGGYIWPTSNDTVVAGQRISTEAELVPPQDRFVLGGGTTVRGYEQDELNGLAPGDTSLTVGGLNKLMANIELRAPLFWRLGLVGFLDMGNVWQNPSSLDLGDFVPHFDRKKVESDDVRYTYGLGLRFATPVGPLRVDYAWKWNFPENPVGQKESRRSGWHVGIGQAF
jgi:outer membrane protein insertion porin family